MPSPTIVCPTCGWENAPQERHCQRCGRPLQDLSPHDITGEHLVGVERIPLHLGQALLGSSESNPKDTESHTPATDHTAPNNANSVSQQSDLKSGTNPQENDALNDAERAEPSETSKETSEKTSEETSEETSVVVQTDPAKPNASNPAEEQETAGDPNAQDSQNPSQEPPSSAPASSDHDDSFIDPNWSDRKTPRFSMRTDRVTFVEGLKAVRADQYPAVLGAPSDADALGISDVETMDEVVEQVGLRGSTSGLEGVVRSETPPGIETEPESMPRVTVPLEAIDAAAVEEASEILPRPARHSSSEIKRRDVPTEETEAVVVDSASMEDDFANLDTEDDIPETPVGRLVVALVILLALVGGGIAVFFSMTENPVEPAKPTPVSQPISIARGPYLQGLANDYRLMFSETCKKIADDPDTECKEDIALKGEIPQKTVEVEAFTIDSLEVSNDRWNQCVKAGVCPEVLYKKCSNLTLQGPLPFLRVPQSLRQGERPVVCTNLLEAQKFCSWAGGRLPTEDEWEKAARGPDAYLFPWGNEWNPEVANWAEKDMARFSIAGKLDGHTDTAAVYELSEGKSAYGLWNMAGNVAEWVVFTNAAEDELRAHARGGSWLSNPIEMRTTARLFLQNTDRRTDVGFRCAYTPPQTSP